MKIKICGLKDRENIKDVAALKPDLVGFIFYPGSPRYVGEDFLLPVIDPSIKKVGVFVDARPDHIIDMIGLHKLDMVQLHGGESPALCEVLSHFVGVIKAFAIDRDFDFGTLNEYKERCHYFLFDTKTDVQGGSGKQFDHSLLENYHGTVPFFLSGGISLKEIKSFRTRIKSFAGFDLNSKFEIAPGLKDITLLQEALSEDPPVRSLMDH